MAALPLATRWDALARELATVLDDLDPLRRPAWPPLPRLLALQARLTALLDAEPDAALYHLLHAAGHDCTGYGARHALCAAVVARLTAQALDWTGEAAGALVLAALGMNASIHRLQDVLALQGSPLAPDTAVVIERHAERSADWLAAAGLTDPLVLDVVRLHHDHRLRDRPLEALQPAEALARLLRRVDVFTARLSCRRARRALSPVRAAREAALGADGMPDEIGTALLLALGLYPPGSTVELVNGESGLVVARGPRPNLPLVAVLRDARGQALAAPLLRATHDRRLAVRRAAPLPEPLPAPPHERLMALAPLPADRPAPEPQPGWGRRPAEAAGDAAGDPAAGIAARHRSDPFAAGRRAARDRAVTA